MDSKDTKTDKIKPLIKQVNQSNIASIKNTTSGIIKIINDIRSTTKDLVDLINLDPPLVAKILKTANSAYYSSGKEIGSLKQAIARIGFNAVNYMALGQTVKDIFKNDQLVEGYSRAILWKHCVAVSILGKLIFDKVFHEDGENIYAAGLLHNIGIIAEDQFLEEEFNIIIERANQEQKNITLLEDEILGFNHTDLGFAILEEWNLPQELVMVVGFHHNPTGVEKEYQKATYTLYVADSLCQEHGFGYCDAIERDSSLFDVCCNELGLTSDTQNTLISDLKIELSKIEKQGIF